MERIVSPSRIQPQDGLAPVTPLAVSGIASRLEEFASTDHSAAVRVFDFDPRRRDAVGLVSAIAPLGDDALQIAFAGSSVQITAPRLEVVDIQ
jgi:hypothetical protein